MEKHEYDILAEIVREHMQREAGRRNAALKRAELTKTPLRESESRFLSRMQVLSRIVRQLDQESAMGPSEKTGFFRSHNCSVCHDGDRPCIEGNVYNCSNPCARND